MTKGNNNEPSGLRVIVKRPWAFLAVFLIIFFMISVFLFVIDFVPEPITPPHDMATPTAPAVIMYSEEPVQITIDTIGVDTPVGNPTSIDITILDDALLSGAVRYPTSAKLGEVGTVYLFGHQSYLPVVYNHAFKAFNDLQKLSEGDLITVSSAIADYTYRVSSVRLTTASDGVVSLASTGRNLVLSTCNSFSSNHEERYLVEATFVSRTPRG
jgi:LPXTG-site transpeptidase (sortase) family protein